MDCLLSALHREKVGLFFSGMELPYSNGVPENDCIDAKIGECQQQLTDNQSFLPSTVLFILILAESLQGFSTRDTKNQDQVLLNSNTHCTTKLC